MNTRERAAAIIEEAANETGMPVLCKTCKRFSSVWPSSIVDGDKSAWCAEWSFHGLSQDQFERSYAALKAIGDEP